MMQADAWYVVIHSESPHKKSGHPDGKRDESPCGKREALRIHGEKTGSATSVSYWIPASSNHSQSQQKNHPAESRPCHRIKFKHNGCCFKPLHLGIFSSHSRWLKQLSLEQFRKVERWQSYTESSSRNNYYSKRQWKNGILYEGTRTETLSKIHTSICNQQEAWWEHSTRFLQRKTLEESGVKGWRWVLKGQAVSSDFILLGNKAHQKDV